MAADQSYEALDLHLHRRKMLRFVWVVIVALLLVAFMLPQVTDRDPLFPIQVQALYLVYLIFCYVVSRWQQFFWLAPYLLLNGLLVMLISACLTQDGINTPASHFIAFIPLLCALTMTSQAAVFHCALVVLAIAFITIIEPNFQIRNASTTDLLSGATLITNSIVVATAGIYISKHHEKLMKALKGKSSFDELTGLPNRYYLRNQLKDRLARSQEQSADAPLVMAFGIDDFLEYNDTKGEDAGDDLLLNAAHAISSLLPKDKDVSLGRSHGDGLMAVFDHLSQEELQYISSKVQAGFKALNLEGINQEPMTISIAVVEFDKENLPTSPISALRSAHQYLTKLQSQGSERIGRFDH